MLHRILITGGSGFVGRHLARRLAKDYNHNYRIVIVDNLSNSKIDFSDSKEKKIIFYKEDIRSSETLHDIFKRERIDTCIHLAAITSVPQSITNPSETIDVNIKGTLSVLEACADNEVANVVFASSAAVYGHAKKLPIPEDHVLEPLSPYGASKVSGEALLFGYMGSGKIKNAASLRFFNIYGEGQNPQYAGVITKFAERLSEGLPPIIFGSGDQTRDFISVEDVVKAIMLSASKANISGVFNIGTGRATSINVIARIMIKAFNLDLEPIYADALEGDIMHSCASIAKSKEMLGFSPVDTIESSLSKPLTWLSNQSKG